MKSPDSNGGIVLLCVMALWVPAMIAASYEWIHGEYYDYGWFVLPSAVFLMFQRWSRLESPVHLPTRRAALAVFLLLVPWILVLRVLGHVDPSWRLPIGLLGLTALAGSHGLIAWSRGWPASRGFLWISLLCLSAMPWPTVLEMRMIHQLTQAVITAVVELFHLLGRPVIAMGDRLQLNGTTVEVTDGCSGIRSFQSFVMATWFFAELQRLRISRALILLACACAVAFVVNASRTYVLAMIRFDHGEAAFQRAHDWLGLLAFAVSALVFHEVSVKLGKKPAGRVTTIRQHRG